MPADPGARPADRTAPRSDRRLSIAELTALLLALTGLALSAYLTAEHYTSASLLACPESATINCAKVTTSPWSRIAGIPVAVLGLAYFVGMTVLTLPALWRRPVLRPLRLIAATAGVAMVIYLIYVELFKVNAICLWCTGVHICTVALFATVLWAWAGSEQIDVAVTESRRRSTRTGRGPRGQ